MIYLASYEDEVVTVKVLVGDADFQVIHRPAVPLEARDAYDRQESAVSDGIETGVEVAADVDLV
ncbi:MAG: hypothetical protein CMJ70_13865, partial [Planctomycetaceae bacterium]|nr:hypothetical protein [Planctomycetaceae bacterium]